MLANDSVTVAVEVPTWLTRPDIAALERHHGIRLVPEGAPDDQTITGHIDFLQIRRRGAYPRLQARRPHQPPVRAAHHLCHCAHPARRASPVRHQVRPVQRGPILRIFPAHGARPFEVRLTRGAKRKLALASGAPARGAARALRLVASRNFHSSPTPRTRPVSPFRAPSDCR